MLWVETEHVDTLKIYTGGKHKGGEWMVRKDYSILFSKDQPTIAMEKSGGRRNEGLALSYCNQILQGSFPPHLQSPEQYDKIYDQSLRIQKLWVEHCQQQSLYLSLIYPLLFISFHHLMLTHPSPILTNLHGIWPYLISLSPCARHPPNVRELRPGKIFSSSNEPRNQGCCSIFWGGSMKLQVINLLWHVFVDGHVVEKANMSKSNGGFPHVGDMDCSEKGSYRWNQVNRVNDSARTPF